MTKVLVTTGPFTFDGVLETKAAPQTCALIEKQLPLDSKIIHVRWSGEGVWIPFGDDHFDVGYENHTSYPKPGQMILYPGGISESEMLLAYGEVRFASKFGQLAGNHFLTIDDPDGNLYELGRSVLWEGAKGIYIERRG
ncbi:DUF3830 family protein [Thalassospiraceae bacterium LMO-JJ14]|nr:DUF3830 family protein [Thalassospiraceae bacterium LMO-JJ14]